MALALAGLAAPALAQTTYTWNRTVSASWTTSTNWTPTRSSPANTDILVFSGSTTPTVTVTAVPQQTIGRLRFINNVDANLSASANVTLTISSATAPSLEIAQGSVVTLAGTGNITLSLGSSATAAIAGSLTFTSQAHVLTSATANAIQFNSPAQFTTGTGFSGSPFGTASQLNVVVFNSGSTYTNNTGNGPWGQNQPNSRVVFNSGSRQIWRSTAGFQTSGRTFANLIVQNNTALSAAGGATFTVDTLTVEAGSSFTHTGSGGSTIVNIKGDILSAGTGAVSITPGGGGIQLNGGKLQTIAGGGTGAVTFGGNATIASGTTLATSRTLTFSAGSMTVNGTFQFNQSGNVTGGGTWVYGAGASLIFAHTSGSFGVSSGSTWWPAASGPTNVTVSAPGITMNAGATRTIAGTLTTSGPITGANLLTLTGTFQLNSGGSVAAAPIYSGTPTLVYNATRPVGAEWGAGAAVGTGVPRNVRVGIPGSASIQHDVTSTTSGTGVTSLTWSLAVGATTNRMLVVGVQSEDAAVLQPSGVTFNGTPLTLINTASGGTTARANSSLWYLVNPAATTANVVVTWPSAIESGTAGAMVLSNVAQQAPQASSTSFNDAGATTTNITTLTNNSWVVDIFSTGQPVGDLTPGAGQTARWAVDGSSTAGGSSTKLVPSAGATSVTWTQTGINRSSQVAAAFAPAGGGTGGGTVTLPASASRTVPGDLTIANGSIVLSSGGDLSIGGNWTNSGTFTANGRPVTFTGTAVQTITNNAGETFATLVLNKTAGSLVLGGPVTCTPTGSSQALTFNGTTEVLNLNGKSLTLNGPVGGTDANSTLTGSSTSDLTIASTLGGSFGTLRFTSGAQSLEHFSINLTGASPTVTLATPVTVNGVLTLNSGVVSPGANTITVAPTGSVSRTNGWVNGTLLQRAAVGSPTLLYPIGTATAYTPVTLTFNNVTVAGDISAKTTTGDHPNIATSGLVSTRTVNRYWTLAGTGTFTSYDATFGFVAGDVDAGVTTDSLETRRFASSAWTGPGIGTRTATSTQALGVTGLGDFAIGEPVTWTITSSAGANGTVSPLGATVVKDRHNATFQMLPNVGYQVAGVLADGVSQGAVTSYTFAAVTANHTVSATFSIRSFTVTLQVAGGVGTVAINPPTGPYTYHSSVTVTATPGAGNAFVGYTQDVVSSSNPVTFLVDSAMTVVANFQRLMLNYTRSTPAGGFTAISTASGASRLLTAADDSTLSVPLPFAFNFSGIPYTTANFLAINANGFAYFSRTNDVNSSPAYASNANLVAQSLPNSVLAPWYDDLNVGAVGTNPAGSVLYQTQGAAGSRTLTVQWTNVSSNNTTTGGQPRRINFQLVLFEASQAIEFRYGTVSGAAYSNLESASIGVEDSLGGNGFYLDAITGSRFTNNGMLTTNRWPSRFIRFTPGAPTPINAGSYNVGSGQTYPTLTDAVADLNLRGVAGNVTFNLTDAVYDTSAAGGGNLFPILVGPIAGVANNRQVTIQSAGAQVATISSRGVEAGNCGTQILPTAISTSNEPVIALMGCDWVTLKNISVVGGNLLDRGVLVLPSSLTDGAQNNTLNGVAVTLQRTNTSTVGIQSTVPSIPSSQAGTNSSNKYLNLNVQNTYAGVSLAGNSSFFDDNNLVSTSGGGTTVIGGPSPGDIGNGTPSSFGFRAVNQSNLTVTGCTIRNVQGTGTGTVDGIAVDNLPSSNLSSGTIIISKNVVQGLSSTATNAGRVTGIRVNLTTEPNSASHIYNNFVYGLNSASTVTASRRVVGILVQDGGSGNGATHNVDFNSVRLQPTNVSCTNTCYEAASNQMAMNTRDNVFSNFTGTQSGAAKHYLMVAPGSGQLGGPGSLSDYNVFYVANSANGFTGLSGGDRALLSDWQAIMASDSHSLASDPQFVSATDLHINAGLPTPVAQAGSYLGAIWASSDIDNEVRHATTPDIGADEGVFQVLTANDIAAASLSDPVDGATKTAGVAFSPQAQFQNTGTSPQTNIPVRYQIRGPLPGTSLVYDQGVTISSLGAGGTQTVTFPPVTIPAAGAFEIKAIASLAGDQNTANDTRTGFLDVSGPLNGTYSVGTGQPYPFNTLTNAINRINVVGVAGPTTFQLIDASYGASETFPINLNQMPNVSASNPFVLRPAPGATVAITGSTARALLVLNGADFVTIDGSNSGTETRDLTLTNTSTTNSSAVIWGQTTSGGDPTTNNTLKNLVLSGNNKTQTLFGAGFGGLTIALKGSVSANNVENHVQNCDIRRVQYGLYSSGVSAASKNTGTVFTRNVMGTLPADAVGQGGVIVRFENGVVVDKNRISSISASTGAPTFGISLGLTHIGSDTWSEDEVTNAVVSHNIIAGVAQTNATGFGAGGIIVAEANSGTNTIDNNMITGVVSPAFDPDITVGILVGGGAGSSRIYYNSVSMTGNRGAASAGSFCLAVGGANPIINIRDNVFFNSQTSSGPGDAYLLGLGYMAQYSNMTADYNDYYTPTGQIAVVGGFGNSPDGDQALLPEWQGTTGKDAHSLSDDPLFVSNTSNLHISTGSSPVVHTGVAIAGFTDDIDGDTGMRSSTPVMGCDEFVTFTITPTVNGAGLIQKSPDLAAYVSGTTVQVQAFPSGNWHFMGWSGDLAGLTNPQTMLMNSNKNITATFAVDSFACAVTATSGGTAIKAPSQALYPFGTPVTLTATANTGFHFTTWSGDTTTTQNPYSLVVTRNRAVEANFAINTYTVSATGVSNGSVTRAPSQATYDHGTTVRLTPVPNTGYRFLSWSGDTTGNVNPLDVVVTRDRAITATFELDVYTLTVNVAGSGSVGVSPNQPTYTPGQLVTLTATPATGFHLVGWSGDTTATTNPLPLPMTGNRTVTATFAINQYAVSAATVGAGSAVKSPDQPQYNHATPITFTATPLAGHSFLGWVGDTTSSANPLNMTVTRPLALTARFTAAVNITVVGSGSVGKSPNLTAYPLGSLVTLTANPITGWHFVNWTGDTTATTNPLTISLPTSRNLTATFAINTYTLALPIVGSGAVTPAPQQPTYDHGTVVQLTATPDPGNNFIGWSGDATGSTNPLNVTMDANKSITATFTWKLTVTSVGFGSVNLSPNQPNYNNGTVVTLTANPQAHVHFGGWTGDTTASTSPLTLTMTRNRNLTANFVIDAFALNAAVTGSGSVTKNPDQATYDWGTPVQLTAVPGPGFHFVNWTGDTATSNNPITMPVTSTRNVTANFVINTYVLNVTAGSGGTAQKSPIQATYNHGTQVTLTATPNVGFHLSSWSGDTASTDNPFVFRIVGNRNINADFVPNQYPLTTDPTGNGSVTRSPDLPTYSHGTPVTLTAVPAAGWHFSTWTGDTTTSNNPINFVMVGPRIMNPVFQVDSYALTVNIVQGQGSVLRSPDMAQYPYLTTVDLTAVPATGFRFATWGGAASGTQPTASVVMDTPKTVTAAFDTATYTLSVSSTGPGSAGYAPVKATYRYPDQVTITATPGAHAHFTGWTGDTTASANPLVITMAADRTLIATFALDQFALDVSGTGSGTIARVPDQALYNYGTPVTVSASPSPGWHFTTWSGDTTTTTNPLNVVVTRARSLTAVFDLTVYPLTINIVGSGVVVRDPDLPNYPEGSTVTVSAIPSPGYAFVGWTGDATGSNLDAQIVMNGPRSATATFTQLAYTLNTTVNGAGSVTKTPNQATYLYGTAVKLTATPADTANHFRRWTGVAGGVNDTTTVIVTGNSTATATFVPNLCDITVQIVGVGSVTRQPNTTQSYYLSNVIMQGYPSTGYQLEGWHGDIVGAGTPLGAYNPILFRADSNMTVICQFNPGPQPVINLTIVGHGVVNRNPNQASYPPSSTVVLTAVPDSGWRFVGWSGEFVTSANPLAAFMDHDKNLTATFAHDTYDLTTLVVGSGSITRVPNQASYNPGSPVQVSASPSPGYHFVRWSGDTTTTNPTVDLTMNKDMVISAEFGHTLTLAGNPIGNAVPTPLAGPYTHGTTISIRPSNVAGWHFVYWSGDTTSTTIPLPVPMWRDKAITAVYVRNQMKLVLNQTAHGVLSKSPDSTSYMYGSDVTIAATPAAGYHFSGWQQENNDFENVQSPDVCEPCRDPLKTPLRVRMISDRLISGSFEQDAFMVLLKSDGQGEIQSAYVPQEGPDSTVVLSATAAEGWTFAGWSGDLSGSQNPIQLKLTAPVDIKARFKPVADAAVASAHAASVLALAPVSPNPAVGRVTFSFTLPSAQAVRLDVVDVQGRRVASVVDETMAAGRHDIEWRGATGGHTAAVGVFFVRLKTDEAVLTRRFALTR